MGDLIDKQKVIDICNRAIDLLDGQLGTGAMTAVRDWVVNLPSVQPEKRTKERTETYACDLISRQEAIDEIGEWIKAFLENGHKESAADAHLIQDGIIQLPSAQPEIVRCKDCKWKQGSGCARFAEVRPFPDDFCSRAERRKR